MRGTLTIVRVPARKPKRAGGAAVLLLGCAVAAVGAAAAPADAADKELKYYFKLVEVAGDIEAPVRELARATLDRELRAHPAFLAELPSGAGAAALRRRGLRGFEVSLRVERLVVEPRPPREGGRMNQLEVALRLTLYGGEIPGRKLAFSGVGEATQISEVFESRLEQEKQDLLAEVMTDAVRQAIEQAVLKLSLPASAPPGAGGAGRGKRRAR